MPVRKQGTSPSHAVNCAHRRTPRPQVDCTEWLFVSVSFCGRRMSLCICEHAYISGVSSLLNLGHVMLMFVSFRGDTLIRSVGIPRGFKRGD